MCTHLGNNQYLFHHHALRYEKLKFLESAPEGISASPEEGNVFVWTASIFDNLGPYAGGCFQLRIVFSKNYSEQEPPRVRFLSPVFHPQVQHTSVALLFSFSFCLSFFLSFVYVQASVAVFISPQIIGVVTDARTIFATNPRR